MTPHLDPRFGSDAMVDLLVDLGVDLLPFAPGATFRGVHDSLVNYRSDAPEIIDCLHEEISVAVAHGYAKATGRLAAAALHDVVGLQHAAMAIYNAWCDRVPLLLLGGTGPVDAALRRPWIDWIHTANVQGTQVRDYTKWDDQPASLAATMESLVRGARLAAAVPRGPVYINVDSEIQEGEVPTDFRMPNADSYATPQPLAAPIEALRAMATRLLAAKRPLIAVESIDRDQAAMDSLAMIAELLGAAVVEVERDYNRTELCFPTDHPLNLSGMPLPFSPDLVLALEVRDLHVIAGAEDAPTLQVTTAALNPKSWAADLQRIQPTEILVHGQVSATLGPLARLLRDLSRSGVYSTESVRARTSELAHYSATRRRAWAAEAGQEGETISPANIAHHVDRVTKSHDRLLANGSLHNWVHRTWTLDKVDQYLGSSGGAGLGYGLGASIGAALAYRGTERLVVDIQSDGDAMMTPGALWTAAHHRVPLLIVVENNRKWGNSFHHAVKIATARGRSTDRANVGTAIDDPPIDFVAMSAAMGITAGWRVTGQHEIESALADATAHVLEQRTPAIVDIRTTL